MTSAPATEAEWWARWRELDFSWDGLALRFLDNPGGDTLQHYWRALRSVPPDADDRLEADGILIRDPQGRRWHVVHAPVIWADGTPSPKADLESACWVKVAECVRAALGPFPAVRGGWQTQGERAVWRVQGRDTRAQLCGAVLKGAFLEGVETAQVNAPYAAIVSRLELITQAFGAGLCFDHAAFCEEVRFQDCRFVTSSWFGAAFFGSADFSRSAFAEGAYFVEARFVGPARFANAPFRHEAVFERAVFQADAEFANGGFERAATFTGARFEARAGLARQSFGDNANFDRATFLKAMTFRSTMFHRFTSFDEITWPAAACDWHDAFDQAIFKGAASFRRSGFGHFAAFNGARFDAGVTVEPSTHDMDDETFQREFEAAVALGKDKTAPLPPNPQKLSAHDVRLRQLEGGCRVLKDAFGKAQDRRNEQRLHRYELLARRRQDAAPRGERGLSWLYDKVARYGESWDRPLWCLVGLWLSSAALFWTLGALADGTLLERLCLDVSRPFDADVIAALNLSASRSLTFGLWAQGGSASWLQDLSLDHGWYELAARLFGSLETAVSLALLFLFGLSLRRRFQIS